MCNIKKEIKSFCINGLVMIDWKEIVNIWIKKKPSLTGMNQEFFDLFEKAFQNTVNPNRCWFGMPKSLASFGITRNIHMVVNHRPNIISIILDRNLSDEFPEYKYYIVKSSIPAGENLYWLNANVSEINKILSNDLIWECYKIASAKLSNLSVCQQDRKDRIEGKYKLNQIFQTYEINIDGHLFESKYLEDLEIAKKDTSKKRLNRIKSATKKPAKITANSTVYLRNKDIVAEVLFRAKGICQLCKKEGPFTSLKTNQPFLEVHHIIPLEEDGEDSLINTVAICPNCHREAHHGINKYEIREKLKNTAHKRVDNP